MLTNHHIVLDGWSMPILLGEIFAGYYGQRLPAPAPYRSFVTWLAARDREARAHRLGARCSPASTTPTLVGIKDRVKPGQRSVKALPLPAEISSAVSELARSRRTTVNVVLQGAWAQLLSSLTGQHDVVFGTTVSGRPAEIADAESMVGLLINTVPVRAKLTAATTTADLLEQLQGAYNDTLEHQHLALNEIHRAIGQDTLFDTFFAYENYPIETGVPQGDHEFAITDITTRESTHYPLTVQAQPGTQLRLRVEYDTDVFDATAVGALIDRFERVLTAMAADPARPVSSTDLLDEREHARLDEIGNRAVLAQNIEHSVGAGAFRRTGRAHARSGGAGVRRPVSDLPGAERGVDQLAHLLAEHGACPGQYGGAAVFAVRRGHRGNPGGAQNRGGLPADRPGLSGGPDRLHARRCSTGRRRHDRRTDRPDRRARPRGGRYRGDRRHRRRRPARRSAADAGRR